jgi:sulfotransferase family protein
LATCVGPDSFFITGCQRSGTTLTRLVLECHSQVHCYDELHAYAILSGAAPDEEPQGVRRWGFKIPRWAEQLTDPWLWDEGLPEATTNFYRGQPILFLLRDVRDTIASMLKLRSGEVSWLEVWPTRIVEAKVERDPGFRSRFAQELDLLAKATYRTLATAALYWKYKTIAFLDYQKRGLPVLAIPYEDLAARPETVLPRVCHFLGVPFESQLLDHPRLPHPETSANGLTVGDTDPRRRIDADSVGQWQRLLTPDQTREILAIAGDLPDRLSSAYPEPARH